MMNWRGGAGRSIGLGATLLFFLTVALYLPALRAEFIWDDDDHLTHNPAMTVPGGLGSIWSSLAISRYYPLTLTSFWVEHELWGWSPLPYHAVNVLLHAANAALVFVLLRRLRIAGAWVAAALWAVHPTGVESVAWVTELKNVQSGLFFLLAIYCCLRWKEEGRESWYAGLLACGTAAMLSKPSTVVLPFVVLLIVWWQGDRWRRAAWWRLAPLFAVALAMAALAIVEQRTQIARGTAAAAFGLADRLVLAARAAWFYLGKTLWPVDLMFVYPRWKIDAGSLLNWLPVIGVIGVAAVLWRWRRQSWGRAGLFGSSYYGLALLPVLGFFDIYFFRYAYVADHFQYLAALGPIALLTAGASRLLRRQPAQWLIALAAVGVLAVSTWRYTRVFHSLETLWQDAATKNPGSALAHNGLGSVLAGQKKPDEAAREFKRALELEPDLVEAHNNLANLLARQGKLAEAAEEYRAALRLKPDFAGAHYNLGTVRVMQDRLDEAIEEYSAALRTKPDFTEARFNLDLARKRRDGLAKTRQR